MASFNKVMLMGNLTRDPELRFTSNGSAVASFGLAVNRKFKQGDEWKDDVCFVDITAWGRQAETCKDYLRKGSSVMVEGRLKYDQWQDRDTGKTRSKLNVTATNVQFLGSPASSNQNQSQGRQYGAQDTSGYTQQPPPPAPPAPPAFAPQDNFSQNQQMPAPQQRTSAPDSQANTSVNEVPAPPQSPPPFNVNEGSTTEDNIPF